MDRSYWSYYAILNILRDFGYVSQDGKLNEIYLSKHQSSFYIPVRTAVQAKVFQLK
jgi:hypothetical protein